MKSKSYWLLACMLGMLVISSCTNQTKRQPNNHDYLIYSTIWFQHSPEMEALYYQGYNIASERLRSVVSSEKGDKPLAVIVDIDETVLDNSPFQAEEILSDRGFSAEFWKEWTALARAEALPGALEFSRLCKELGVTLFYLSNRHQTELQHTMQNLDSLGFAFVKPENFLLKTTTSNKEARRKRIEADYRVVLLIGDNLGDFAEIFEDRSIEWGKNHVEQFREQFGRRFIILPNPMYGKWTRNIYGTRKLNAFQKDSARRAVLKGFR